MHAKRSGPYPAEPDVGTNANDDGSKRSWRIGALPVEAEDDCPQEGGNKTGIGVQVQPDHQRWRIEGYQVYHYSDYDGGTKTDACCQACVFTGIFVNIIGIKVVDNRPHNDQQL